MPPCDIKLMGRDILIEVQGATHFLDLERRKKTSSTALKNELYRRRGFTVIQAKTFGTMTTVTHIEGCINNLRHELARLRF